MKRKIAAVLAVIAASGCATSETVYLRNATGQTVKCGPYTHFGNIPAANSSTESALRDCVADYQRQGYEFSHHNDVHGESPPRGWAALI